MAAEKRTKSPWTLPQLMFVAVVLLGTVVNFFAITTLGHYERSVSRSLSSLGITILSPTPQRKLSQDSPRDDKSKARQKGDRTLSPRFQERRPTKKPATKAVLSKKEPETKNSQAVKQPMQQGKPTTQETHSEKEPKTTDSEVKKPPKEQASPLAKTKVSSSVSTPEQQDKPLISQNPPKQPAKRNTKDSDSQSLPAPKTNILPSESLPKRKANKEASEKPDMHQTEPNPKARAPPPADHPPKQQTTLKPPVKQEAAKAMGKDLTSKSQPMPQAKQKLSGKPQKQEGQPKTKDLPSGEQVKLQTKPKTELKQKQPQLEAKPKSPTKPLNAETKPNTKVSPAKTSPKQQAKPSPSDKPPQQQAKPKTNSPPEKKQQQQQQNTSSKAKEASSEKVNNLRHYIELSRREGHDKERILHLLRDNAKIPFISDDTYEELPSWSQVTALYGNKPVFVDQDQCEVFKSQGDLADKFIGVAGAFDTGTNLLADVLTTNCVLHKRQEKYGKKHLGVRWQVPYGKHVPPHDAEFRASNVAQHSTNVDPNSVLPAIMVRDPFRWLQSMCLNFYTSRWPRVYRPTDPRYHCPNLYPTEAERAKLLEKGFEPILDGSVFEKETPGREHIGDGAFVDKQTRKERLKPQVTQSPGAFTANEPNTVLTEEELQLHYFPVKVGYKNFTHNYESLVHLWSEWNQNYHQLKDYPHIFVRYEDLLYFPDEVATQVCQCAGGRLIYRNKTTGEPFPVKVSPQSQKEKHDSRVLGKGQMQHTGYLAALIRYAKSSTRFRGMTSHDLQYAGRYLDKDLMDLFHYSLPSGSEVHSDA